MEKKRLMNPSHVLIFVEGDTDEVFFKALIDYYTSVSTALDMSAIRNKRQDVLAPLEEALGVVMP